LTERDRRPSVRPTTADPRSPCAATTDSPEPPLIGHGLDSDNEAGIDEQPRTTLWGMARQFIADKPHMLNRRAPNAIREYVRGEAR